MRGPLHDLHVGLGAKFVEFSGYDMPVSYRSIKEEHEAVRNGVGLFDVSHMGNVRIDGEGAAALLDRCTVSDPYRLEVGHGVYSVLLDYDASIIDDTIFYRVGDEAFYMVPNAGKHQRIANWLRVQADEITRNVDVYDESLETCIFALQGPKAPDTLKRAGAGVPDSPRFRIHEAKVDGVDVRIATTGYTGETGYELFVPVSDGERVFRALLDAGTRHDILPIGLGARDTLRLEMAYALAGHEFEGGRTPLEAGLSWTIKWDHEFIGKARLIEQKQRKDYARLVGLEVTGRGIAREGYAVLDGSGEPIGKVTSGTQAPTVGKAIALAYVDPGHAKKGTELAVEVRGKPVDAVVVATPFLKR